MKRFLVFTCQVSFFWTLLCFSAPTGFSQNDLPPPEAPKPLPKLTPNQEPKNAVKSKYVPKWQKYISQAGAFEILLPGAPVEDKNQVENSAGKFEQYHVTAYGRGFTCLVSYLDFPAPVTDREEIRIRYDFQRDGILRRNKKLFVDKEVVQNNRLGRELAYPLGGGDEPAKFLSVSRVFLVQQRSFVVQIIFTDFNAQNDELTFEQKELSNFYLNSFKITNVPPPKMLAAVAPADLGLEFNGKTMSSSYLGVSVTFSDEWQVFDSEQLEKLLQNAPKTPGVKPEFQKYIDFSNAKTKYLGGAVSSADQSQSAFIVFAVGNLNFPTVTLQNFVKDIRNNEIERFKNESVSEIKEAKIDKMNFAFFDVMINKQRFCRSYFTILKQMPLEISYCYTTESQLKGIEQTLQTITFK